jgi:two-component system, cell cycle sensor histidine kinase and response regulator CckA
MDATLRVLIIEDSEDDAVLIVRELEHGGFDVTHLRVDSAGAMRAALDAKRWDLVIGDHTMPGFSGIEAMNIFRERELEAPFIFVSGTLGEDAAVAALKSGAQDYVLKGNLKRLVPAIRRELREVEKRREHKRLELQVRLLQRFEALGRLAGGIAHDFNNMIGAILGWAEIGYEEAPSGTTTRERFRKIADQATRAAGLTRQILAFARRQFLEPRNIDLNLLVAECVNLLEKLIGGQVRVTAALASDLEAVWADPTQIEQVLTNLCLNARDAMPRGGNLRIETSKAEIAQVGDPLCKFAKPGRYVLLSVSDTGAGMDAATLEHIFEPFFTTKGQGKGTGLGLATVYGIVKQHNGCIDVVSECNQGTTFRVYLPVGTGPAEHRERSVEGEVKGGTETILVAEDSEALAEVAREFLVSFGYTVLVAGSGAEAVRLFEAKHDSVALVLLDVVMPAMSGPDAYAKMRAIRPGLPVVFTTGFVAEATLLDVLAGKRPTVLQKPYGRKSLGQIIRTVLDQRQEQFLKV